MRKKYKGIDLFCGIGGFRLAMNSSQVECVFSSDNDKFAQQTYEANFHEVPTGDIKAVNDLSFSVYRGELFAFLGVNGAGKSTTISIMCGQVKKDSGKIVICGKDTEKNFNSVSSDIGVVFQNSVLDKALSVKDNLRSRAALYGITGKEFKNRLDELSELLGFEDILNRTVGKLSGGQRRRIDIARALLHNPKILILDEPTNHLDITHQIMLMELVKKLNVTVISAIHDLNIAAAYCDKIYVLKDGVLEGYGTPQEVLTPELIKRIYQVDSEVVNDSRGKMHILFL